MLPALLLAIPLLAIASPQASYKQVQIAASGDFVAAVFGSGNDLFLETSRDAGKTFSKSARIATPGIISLGLHRGPRIAITNNTIIVSVVSGTKGKGSDGDLLAYRSTDQGTTWSQPVRINDVEGAPREGLHAMAAGPNGLVYAAWLDLRKLVPGKPGTRLYGTVSTDAGRTWSSNSEIYASPSGTICQCCHPSLAIDAKGTITVMFRNAVDGNRDLYVTQSKDRGHTFSAAQKLGTQSWKLDACPMDGGDVALDADATPVTIWRRETTVFIARPGSPEQPVQTGKNPALAFGPQGRYAAWTDAKGLEALLPNSTTPTLLDAQGAFPQLLRLSSGQVLAAWERQGQIIFKLL